jgi:tetratricopeptide (TPR) repeat protein
MKNWAVLLLSTMLVGCATVPEPQPDDRLFNDQLFAAPSERIGAENVFALSDAMKHYARTELAGVRSREVLIDALYNKGQLRLEFDSEMTRNASQAFEARSGNCLSLVIMTAAFAKELGLSVQYQDVLVEEAWSRSGDIYFSIGHVNLTLGTRQVGVRFVHVPVDLMTVDFLPPRDVGSLRTRVIGEETIIAMYMNNRAAETLSRGQVNDAYWWAREAIRQDPRFLRTYNTLGVIYQRHGNFPQAEQVLRYALEREPKNTIVMSNLASVLNDLGRIAESTDFARKLEQLEPNPPFSFFKRGLAAMHDGDFKAARDLFAKEVARDPYYHEFRYWLAAAYAQLGDLPRAKEQLAIALENSTTRKEHDLYAAKLDRIRASRFQ